MQWWVNFFRGWVVLQITGAFPERFLNLCGQEELAFWGVEWLDGQTLRIRVAYRERRHIQKLAQRSFCTVVEDERTGAPFFLAKFRRRYALLIGLALSACTVVVLAQFVLTVEVVGNERVPTTAILWELQRQGVKSGVFGPSIDLRGVSNEALLMLPELSWMTINLHGTRAEVIVRESDPKPEVTDLQRPSDVVADATGLIVDMEVLRGDPLVAEGDMVVEGDVLITGVVDIKEAEYSTVDMGVRLVHGEGRVYARTWRTLTAQIPVEAAVKSYTGEEKKGYSLTIFGHTVKISTTTGISFPKYDKIKETKTLKLPNGQPLPLSLNCVTCRAYQPTTVAIDVVQGEKMLQAALAAQLELLVEDGEIVTTAYEMRENDGMLVVELRAECREEIGRTVPLKNILEGER